MRIRARTIALAAALLLALAVGAAHAQFGIGSLPQNDFTWRWGEQRGSRIDDFSMRAHDQGFECTLTGELRAGSRLSRIDLRNIENEIRSSLSFVVAATNYMNALEGQRDLDWAVLDCVKPDPEEEEEEEE